MMKTTRTFRKVQFAWIALLISCLAFANCREANKSPETEITSVSVEEEIIEYTERDTLISHPNDIHPVIVR